ncbi:helix-turn-helix domain-containing protein [Poseidonocella sedimentorum]|uniref:Protein RodZ, contains Xre-like HTH and DUF4115 domains n=1 Tax=Poseidonocella sedimentorum TaxID=871652 RepID=A0A1I6CND7_9RHOB|nr:helix-turn-helix domain-containing protein [Poseidonocella sedimentorum]SFQ94679.1 protein RodZ, contains Xre-like HTH and DUF4115 domains [Poseidonocella sedimentorum]
MILRRGTETPLEEPSTPKGFDDFDLRLGDSMRGERATLGKSLLDVQRELKIKAAYIAAIENSDPSAFDTPGFIAGYVRSYARYLGMDAEKVFQQFCEESGFSVAHGMAPEASSRRAGPDGTRAPRRQVAQRDVFTAPSTPFTPQEDRFLSGIAPGAVGSSLALVAVIGLLGFGGWTVLKEVQRVRIAPVDQAPVVVSDLDPLTPARAPSAQSAADGVARAEAPTLDALDRLYRPQALDVPVLVKRDAPISTLNPNEHGAFADMAIAADAAERAAEAAEAETLELAAMLDGIGAQVAGQSPGPQVLAETPPDVVLLAVRPVWVRVRAVDGSVIFEKILDAGEEFILPQTEEAPTLRAGNSGSLFFKVAGEVYGPAGAGTSVAKNVALSVEALRESYQVADLSADPALEQFTTVAEAGTD